MDPKLLSAIGAAGAAGDSAIGVEDVFKTYVYTGNSTARDITTNVDMSDGGMVWIKARNNNYDHYIVDTERGALNRIRSNSDSGSGSAAGTLTAFNNDGFSLGTDSVNLVVNDNTKEYVSWSFKKQKKFFTCLTYSGNSTARTISHDLGSVPGFIVVKRTSGAQNWVCQHRVPGATKEGILNETGAWYANTSRWNDTAPTDEVFSVGTSNDTNESGHDYIAYLWAHEEAEFGPNSDQSIISCGSYTGTGSAGISVSLPFEPQYLLIKISTDDGSSWMIFDSMRGVASGGNDAALYAQATWSEYASDDNIDFTPTGFEVTVGSNVHLNNSGSTHVFIAIATETGKTMKAIETGSDVFAIDTGNSNTDIPNFDSGFPVDFAWSKLTDSSGNWWTSARLLQGKELKTNNTDAEASGTNKVFDSNVGWHDTNGTSSYISHMWKRHAGFDVVCDIGSGSNKQVSHSLSQTPEMIFRKCRDSAKYWIVYHKDLPSSGSALGYLYLNSPAAAGTYSPFWNQAPTATHFTVGSDNEINISNEKFITLLFSSVKGVSHVGSYTGTGSAQTITIPNGGFQPRFLIIKLASTPSDGTTRSWYVFDTTRGWSSGNDQWLELNEPNAQFAYDVGQPTSTGFTLADGTISYNGSGETYIYYCHA